MQDDRLIRRAAKGDDAAFEQLLLQNQKQVYNLCYRMTGNADDALDLSQEAFLRAWRNLNQYQFDAAFSTWLYRLTTNICIDFLRQQKKHAVVSLSAFSDETEEGKELELPDPDPLPEEQAMTEQSHEAIAAALKKLPEDYRQILLMRVVEDLPYDRIAQLLGIQMGTVKSRLARARMQLKKLLENGNKDIPDPSNK